MIPVLLIVLPLYQKLNFVEQSQILNPIHLMNHMFDHKLPHQKKLMEITSNPSLNITTLYLDQEDIFLWSPSEDDP